MHKTEVYSDYLHYIKINSVCFFDDHEAGVAIQPTT